MKRHSLLFGVQNYPDHGALKPLKFAHADVDALASMVSDPRFMVEVGQVTVVKDPTHTQARQAFRAFFAGVDREDVALIHFSGHGLRDDAGDLFLCFTDAQEDDLEMTAIKVGRLGDWLAKKRLRRALITLDCCYSGAAGAQMTRDSLTSALKSVERPMPDGTGLYVLSSADATQRAKEGAGRGIFTHHLLEGILSGAADGNNDGEITVSELAEYLQRQVPKDASLQMPQLTAHKVSGTFVVARNPAKIEADTALKLAEEAATRARERAEIADAAYAKLKEHVAFGSVSLAFAGAVHSWVDANRLADGDSPRFGILRDFASGRLTAIELFERWNASSPEPPFEAASSRSAVDRKRADVGPQVAERVGPWVVGGLDARSDGATRRYADGRMGDDALHELGTAEAGPDSPAAPSSEVTAPRRRTKGAEPRRAEANRPDAAPRPRKPARTIPQLQPDPVEAAASATPATEMSFFKAVGTCLANYATFSGRAKRPEYWWFVLFTFGGATITAFLDVSAGNPAPGPLTTLFYLGVMLPSLAVTVRRLRDVGRTWQWLFLAAVPPLGFILIYWLAQPGRPDEAASAQA